MIMSIKSKIIVLVLSTILPAIFFTAHAQVVEDINKLFDAKNYDASLKGYQSLLKKDTNNLVYKYKVGFCILNLRMDRSKAIPYFEAVLKQPKPKYICWFELGRAYQYANKFDSAIYAYKKAIELGNKKEKEAVERAIETCNNAKELIKKPINVSFYNIGKKVNTEFADYYPIASPNDDMLYFTSRRKGNTGNSSDADGIMTSDIYVSENKLGVFQKPKNLGVKVNTAGDEQITGITADGKKIILYYDYGGKQFGDLQISQNPKKEFEAGKPISGGVNSTYFETAGCFNAEGTQIYFSSDRPDKNVGRNIFVSTELPDGEWSDAIAIDNINSEFDEDFPQLSPDGLTLHFSSNGFNSMGGFDIFKSEFDTINKVWGKPENIGFPINSSYDEICFSTIKNGEHGYMSKIADEGNNDFDIYKVIFNDKSHGQFTIVHGLVIAGDSIKPNVKATVYVVNKLDNDTVGIYNTKYNGKFLLILPINDYKINIETKGFDIYSQELKIDGGENFKQKDAKTFRLKSQGKTIINAPIVSPTNELKVIETPEKNDDTKYVTKIIKGKKVRVKLSVPPKQNSNNVTNKKPIPKKKKK